MPNKTIANPIPILQRLAQQRGWSNIDWQRFLDPTPPITNTLRALPGTDLALARIAKAVKNNERILVYGDYDVDGITSVSLLIKTIRATQCRWLHWQIPDRNAADYGLDHAAVDRLLATAPRPNLVITLDCGSGATTEIQRLADQGIDTIVIDHHQTVPNTPHPSIAHLNPKAHLLPEPLATDLGRLCTAGLAFLFTELLQTHLELPNTNRQAHLIIAGLGTIADAVELQGTNRNIVKLALRAINDKQTLQQLPGLACQMETNESIKAQQLAFGIVPKLNATGRIARADIAVDLLLTNNADQAKQLAQRCTELNDQRKEIQQHIMEEAEQLALASLARDPNQGVLLLYRENWHPSIVGIVAGRLKDNLQRSIILLGRHNDGYWRGSGRNFGNGDLGQIAVALVNRKLAHRGGGHRQAIGLKATTEQLDQAAAWLQANYRHDPAQATQTEYIGDWDELPPEEWCQLFNRLEPFGQGNPKPSLRAQHMQAAHASAPLITKLNHVWAMKNSFTNAAGKTIEVITKNLAVGICEWTTGSQHQLDLAVGAKEYHGRRYFNWVALQSRKTPVFTN